MGGAMRFTREFAMPSGDTLSVKPIGEWTKWLVRDCKAIVDPFARNCTIAHYRNDLNPDTAAEYHMDAEDFLLSLRGKVSADAVIFDPPYSPRQISEIYKGVGRSVGMKDTQSSVLYKRVRDAADTILADGGIVLSYGWNSCGMGVVRGYTMFDMLVVCHGGAHNDTLCVAERKGEAIKPLIR